MDEQTENLAKELANDSVDAFTAIYDEYFLRLLNFAQSLLDNRQDAEDVCGDVFANLWEMRTRFNDIKNIKSFLYISVRNACLNLLRSAQVKKKSRISIEELEDIDPENIEDIRTEYKIQLSKDIERLPPQCQLIFKLAYYEELTNDEIAKRLGITKRTVTNQKVRAKQLLRNRQGLLANFPGIIWFLAGAGTVVFENLFTRKTY